MVDELDRAFAEMLLKNEPSPQNSWIDSLHQLSQAFRNGKLFLNRCDIVLPDHLIQKPLILEGNRIYCLRSYRILQSFIEAMNRFTTVEKSVIDLDKAFSMIENAHLDEKQRAACRLALTAPVTLIMGGPGTGKTYTAAHIVKALQGNDFKIALAAPTGKAASNLKTALEKITSTEGIDDPKTLHALLRLSLKSKTVKVPYQLAYDLYLVDEASMIDMELMTALFRSMKPTAKLILLGDPNQLPPIDLGAPFEEIAEGRIPKPPGLEAIKLTTCVRSESEEILDLSERILENDPNRILDFFKEPKESIEFVDIDQQNVFALQKEIVHIALNKYEAILNGAHTPHALFVHQKEFSILTPFRVGPLGSETLNQMISAQVKQQSLALPIMIRENRPDLGLYNGDIGFLIQGDEPYGLFKDNQEVRSISELLLPAFEFAFCLSIHKSQGSEFTEALIIMPPDARCFGKKILYTALTRVKKRARLFSTLTLLSEIVCTLPPQSH